MLLRRAHDLPDLMPPPFSEGLEDWSCGDGTPEDLDYSQASNARLTLDDADFGPCLEIRKLAGVDKLRYRAEMPFPPGVFLAVSARLKPVRGPQCAARIAAWTGGAGGYGVPRQHCATDSVLLGAAGTVTVLRTVIGRERMPGVDLIWDRKVLFSHIGLDLVGAVGAVVRIESLEVRDVTAEITGGPRVMPGFEPRDLPKTA